MEISPNELDAHNAEHAAIPASKAYYVGTHPYQFLAGVPAEILGVKMVTPAGETKPRPCFHVRYPDGREDYAAMQDEGTIGKTGFGAHCHILSEEQVNADQAPPVAN